MVLQRHGLSSVLRICLSIGVLAMVLSCSQKAQDSQKETDKKTDGAKTVQTPTKDPRTTLRTMFDRYRQCKSYSDRTEVMTTVTRAGKQFKDSTQLSIEFVRPNKLRLILARDDYQLTATANESNVLARVKSPMTDDFAGQVVHSRLQEQLTVRDLYMATECRFGGRPEQTTSLLWSLPIDLSFTQLGMLLSNQKFEEVFPIESKIEQLDSKKVDGINCIGIRVTSADGKNAFVFRIDPVTFLLKRLEFPTEENTEQQVETTISTVVREANLDDVIDEGHFETKLAKTETPVRFFIEPPLPLPTDLFGKRLPDFELATLRGEVEKSEFFSQKHVVFVWFDRHPESKIVLTQLQQLADEFTEFSDQVIFRAIISEPATALPNRQVRELLDDWKVSIPVNRDLKAVGRDQFGVGSAPTCVIFGSDQSVHLFEVGANPQIGETVRIVLKSLLRGVNVGAGVVSRFRAEMEDFQTQLASARSITGAPQTIKEITFPKRTEPNKLKLRYGWKNEEIVNSGNLISIQNNGTTKTVAVVPPNQIVQLNSAGQVTAKTPIPIGNDDSVSVIRPFKTKQGTRYFYAFSPMGKKVYVFNENLDLILKYPTSDRDHTGIQDALLADLDNNQQPELYVAFGDPIGLHQVNTNGKRTWSSRQVAGIQSIDIDRSRLGRILVSGEQGVITPIFVNGQIDRGVAVGNRTIHRLASAGSRRGRPTEFVGLTLTIDGRIIAVGLDRQLKEQWSYGLPNGIYQSGVEIVTAANTLASEATTWLFAGPDGSLHFVADDGSFHDSFQFGERIDGVSAYRENNNAFVLVASPTGVQQIQIERE